jgi:hypothetical protein
MGLDQEAFGNLRHVFTTPAGTTASRGKFYTALWARRDPVDKGTERQASKRSETTDTHTSLALAEISPAHH